jgi:hypothetical protein
MSDGVRGCQGSCVTVRWRCHLGHRWSVGWWAVPEGRPVVDEEAVVIGCVRIYWPRGGRVTGCGLG